MEPSISVIFIQLNQQLQSLKRMLVDITDAQFTKTIVHLSNASIGEHTRHIIELMQCAIVGYHTGVVDYLSRKRNIELQQNRMFAINSLDQLLKQLDLPDQPLKMVVTTNDEPVINTTYFREVVYNMVHTIHHLALIKVALIEMNLDLVASDFGMAYSTIQYKTSNEAAAV